jgi:hypothetical protein
VDIDTGSERGRRIRDAVEAALSDILLLGTEQPVRLAGRAAQELTAGNPSWSAAKAAGYELHYWQQTPEGWQEKGG